MSGRVLLLALVAQSMAVPQFNLADTDGVTHTPSEWAGKRAAVFLFVSTDCPLSNSYVPELNRLAQTYAPRGFAFYGVQGDATTSNDVVRRHVKDFGYAFPYLLDPEESLAAWIGATVTPEAAVLSARGELLYRGRIDNRLEDYGERRTRVTEFDLRNALDAIDAGHPVARPRTPALGCAIVRKH
jgi:peroxiredoxin